MLIISTKYRHKNTQMSILISDEYSENDSLATLRHKTDPYTT